MPGVRSQRARRWLLRAAAGAALLGLLALAAFLPFAGRYLVSEDPLDHADVALVLAGTRVERGLEAVDLYKEGWVTRILLSPGREEPAEAMLRAKGVRFPTEADHAREALVQLGIPAEAIDILPVPVDNTAEEAAALHAMLGAAQWRRIIVITSRYHTRRTQFAFEREFRGMAVDVRVRASRYDEAEPGRWWANRHDFRFVTLELQKLLAYRLGLAN
jgi:uncharacterized SAM-binding protein YcdF (DUF218 family)